MRGALESLGVLVLRVIIALMAVAFVVPEMAFAQEEDKDYWGTETELSEKDLKNFLSQERCYANENNFYGCIQALGSLFSSAEEPLALTNSKTESNPQLLAVVKEVEGLKLKSVKEVKRDSRSLSALVKEQTERRTLSTASWKEVYANTQTRQLSINKLLTEALILTKKERLAETYAMAINTYLNVVVDPHTYIKTIAETEDQMTKTEKQYSGIGSYIKPLGDTVLLQPMENSPALRDGVKYNDVLTHVDGKSTAGKSVDEIRKLIIGTKDTVATLQVLRKGQPVTLKVTRGDIAVKNLSAKVIDGVGYMKLASFMKSGLCFEFVKLARELHAQGAKSLILDVRNNGGGSLDEVLCMSASYVERGLPLLSEQDPEGKRPAQITMNTLSKNFFMKEADLYNLFGRKPLVMLINSGSASASELLPGSLRPHGRVVTVGERSFGKGTVQRPSSDLSVIGLDDVLGVLAYKTVSRFHFADGSSNQLHGITPDFEIYSNPNPTEDDKFSVREADMYENAIGLAKKPRTIPEVARTKIANCVAKKGKALKEYTRDEGSAMGPDYQLSYAKDVANCL